MEIDLCDVSLTLLPEKALLLKKERILLLADLHLGKINHFRKLGIPVPAKANEHNLEVLWTLINRCKPERVIFLGDLFHSHYNQEWEVFGEFINHYQHISFELILGNHDVMSERQYERKRISVVDRLTMGPFLLTHHPLEEIPAGSYNLAGHIHPGVSLLGGGRQRITLPCFHFAERQGILPAFGKFTGLARISPKRSDRIFVVTDDKIIAI